MWDQNIWAQIFSSVLKTRPALFFHLKIIMKNLALVQGKFICLFGGSKCNPKKPEEKHPKMTQEDSYQLCNPYPLPYQCSRGKSITVHYQKREHYVFKHLYIATHTHIYIYIYILNHYLNQEQRPSSQRRICNLKTEVRFKMASLRALVFDKKITVYSIARSKSLLK